MTELVNIMHRADIETVKLFYNHIKNPFISQYNLLISYTV